MRKKRICIFLALILSAVFLFFYLKPQPVYLEMPMCSQDGETIQFVLSGNWYRQFGGKRVLMGDVWVDGAAYHSLKLDNWNWKDQKGKKLISPFLGERWKPGGFPIDELDLDILSEELYCVRISLWDEDSSITYYGPAASKEECELLLREWADDY